MKIGIRWETGNVMTTNFWQSQWQVLEVEQSEQHFLPEKPMSLIWQDLLKKTYMEDVWSNLAQAQDSTENFSQHKHITGKVLFVIKKAKIFHNEYQENIHLQ